MKYRLLIPLCCLLALSCSREVTIMSYNVGAFSKYGGSSIPDVARIIRSAGAVTVGLNEVDSCNRRNASFQLADLAAELGAWNYHYASAFPFAGGAYGNGIVSITPILSADRIDLPKLGGYEPRSVAVVETRDFVFASTHLDVGDAEANRSQAVIINNWFRKKYAGYRKPVILCGDMNATPGSPTISELGRSWERLSVIADTYSTEEPHICIDYVFRLKDAGKVTVLDAGVIGADANPDVATASDHLPIYVKLKLK